MIRSRHEPRLDLKKRAFKHQVDAFEAIKNLEYAAVFHEQGLGKTKIAIDLVVHWLQSNVVDSVLIVAKKGLIENWRSELEYHSYLKPGVLTQKRKDNFYLLNSPTRVYLAHYEVCRSEEERLQIFLRTRSVGVILDESHKIKNPESALSGALLRLAPGFTRRLIMTGTPVANRPYDIWSQIKFLDGGWALGRDFAAFRNRLDLSADLSDDLDRRAEFEASLTHTLELISGFCVRETKDSSGISLPSKEIRSINVTLEDIQAELYRKLKNELRAVVIRDGFPTMDEVDDLLKRLLRLVQVASNPRLVDQSYSGQPGKFAALARIVDIALDEGSKLIVWTAFTANADWLARQLKSAGAVRVHGKMSIEARNQSINRFKNDDTAKVLVATPGAAKEGLTLTVANRAVFYDRTFSLDDYLQAQDRIHRISQTEPCVIYNLIGTGTVDEWVDELLAAKHLAARLLQGDMDHDEYKEMATYDFRRVLSQVLEIE